MTDKTPPSAAPETATAAPTTPPPSDAEKAKGKTSNAVWMGTAVGVGSAALVAALMYASRRNSKKA